MKIRQVKVKIINDSRGDKTLEVNLILDGQQVTASVPSGKSKGSHEAFVLEPELAIKKLEEIKPKIEKDFSSLEEFDKFLIELDGTAGKMNLGGNLILALSIAFTKAWAKLQNLQTFQLIAQISKQEAKLPLCFFNLIEGGVHAKNSLPFQEYLLVPQTNSPKESLNLVQKFIEALAKYEHKEFGKLRMGDEGGFTVPSQDPEMGLKILQEVFSRSLLEYSRSDPIASATNSFIQFGLDAAAATFYHDGGYMVGNETMSRDELLSYYQLLTTNYQLFSIEDPFDEEDWQGFSEMTTQLGNKVWIIGDDLITTNPERIKLAHEKGAVNAVIIKPNQIGSVSESIKAAVLAKSYGWKIIVSHRSGETMDDFIADLAFGIGADGFKSGCPLQKERLVKYERLIEIESRLTMSYLVLVRHGESTWNAKGIWTGITDVDLTEKGREEVRKAAESIKEIKFQLAFISNLKRAKETLEEMEKVLGVKLPIIENVALTERDYGDYTGKNKWEVKNQLGDEEFLKLRRFWDYPIPNGESLKDVYDRVILYYQEAILPELKAGKNILVSAHGNSLRALAKYLDNISDEDISKLEIPTGQVLVYSIDQDGKVISKDIRGAVFGI